MLAAHVGEINFIFCSQLADGTQNVVNVVAKFGPDRLGFVGVITESKIRTPKVMTIQPTIHFGITAVHSGL